MIAENYKIVPVGKEIAMDTNTKYSDSINMKGFHKATFVITFNTLADGNNILTVTSGTTATSYTTALYFNYALGGAAVGTAVAGSTASCDVLADWTNAATLTLTYGTYTNKMLVVEVDAASMDIANGYEWLSLVFTYAATSTGNASVIAILEPRYKSNRSGTCLA